MDEPPDTLRRRARRVDRPLAALYPEGFGGLAHESPLQLLIATILSAQCTDARVNAVTPALFARFPTAESFADARPEDLEALVRSVNYYRTKARNIRACCRQLIERHGGRVPDTLDELVRLPRVGRKTANVVLGHAFAEPGVTVDTHVGRLSRRLGLTTHTDPAKVERDLMGLLPRRRWTEFGHLLILHGRRVC